MVRCMRTALTIDDDAALLAVRRRRGGRLRDVVNAALRRGLVALQDGDETVQPPYRVGPIALGTPLLASYDDVADDLAQVEGDGFR